MHVDRCEKMMKKAGYNQRQILDYWDDVLFEPGYCDRCLGLSRCLQAGASCRCSSWRKT